MDEKRVNSISVISNMVSDESIKEIFKILEKNPNLKMGLHTNLIEGKCLSGKEYVPTLVNNRHQLFRLPVLLLKLLFGLVDRDQIKREIEKQIDHLLQKGLKISFIDSHQHLHAFSPIAEIITDVAKQKNIQTVRNYNAVKTFTLIAKIKYQLLKLAALATHIICYGKFGLPVTWNGNQKLQYSFMSWESGQLDISKISGRSLVFVTHPYLPFDSNRSYIPFLI